MATVIDRPAAQRDPKRIAGRALSGLAILFLAADAIGKLVAPEAMIANSHPLGLPADPGFYRLLGVILLVATALYAWPRTAFLGAVLLTGYLGGAVATHVRLGNPLFTHMLFPIYVAVLLWGGLWLRSREVRAVFPLRARRA